MTARLTQGLGKARSVLAGFTAGQRSVVVAAALVLILGSIALTRWAAQPTWTPLFTNLSASDANAIVEQLRGQNVQYQLSSGGSTVMVPQSQVYDLRVSLGGKGLPSSTSSSYSILDSQGMTATDFQQNVAYQRALEAELAKTLQAIDGVRTAIVHLAVPKKDVFTTDTDKPTASVLLSMTSGTTLGSAQVRAITNLVAGSVPELKPDDVTVTDSSGTLLSAKTGGAGAGASVASELDAQTAAVEDRLTTAAQQMLDRVLGTKHAVVRVNAQLNFDANDTVSKTYLSNTAPPLVMATSSESYGAGGAGAGGPLGQTYPTLTQGAAGAGGGGYVKVQSTVNNAVGQVESHNVAAPGKISRLTVAVLLDSASAGSVNNAMVQQMVSNAVGLDTTRGDTVQVDKLAFDTSASAAAAKELADAKSAATTAQYVDLAQKLGIGLAGLILFLLLRRRKKKGATVEAVASDLPESRMLEAGSMAAIESRPYADFVQPVHHGEEAPGLEDRDRLRAEVAEFVDSQPDEIAALVQGWLSQRKT